MKYRLSFLFVLIAKILSAQTETISILPMYGSILKHSPAYKPAVTEPSVGFQFSYHHRIKKGSRFFEKFNYPSIGVNFIACNYGDNEVFGNSASLTASFNFYLLERKKWNLLLTTGMGIGNVSKEYDRATNNTNNVIGSHLNMTPHLSVSSQLFLTKNFFIQPSAGIVHHSNGHIQLPNLGINYMNLGLGAGIVLKDNFSKDSFIVNQSKFKKKKNEITALIGLSDRGSQDDRHILPTYGLMYHRLYYTSDINVLKLGASIEYKNDDYGYEWFKDEQNTDLAIVVGDELFFGRLSFNLLVGVYAYSELAWEKKKYSFQRWGLSYRLPVKSDKYEIITGAHLKTHYGAAELTELRMSMLF